ncbi:hypothetical protein H7I53_23965 [Mycolicibacterium pulveris]|nr:hypothetical protein [Mycolicibacterium pulveris]MCV6983259.1 hypothetical protein [Mycolicibacterium pulveris]
MEVEQRWTPAAHKLCLSMGIVLTVLYLTGWVFLAKFVPVPSPDWPAEQLAGWLAGHQNAYQAGCILMLLAGGLLAPWGASLTVWNRRAEGRLPVLHICELATLAASVCIFVIIAIFWALAGFRAGQIDPQITQAFFDAGWFLFLWAAPCFYLWALSFGLALIMNPPEHQMFPRWIGFFTAASVLCWAMGPLAIFFQSGSMSYSGAIPTWIPVVEFFAWVVILSVYGYRAIMKHEAMTEVYRPTWDDPIVPNGVAEEMPRLTTAELDDERPVGVR